jgi:hypothetical protein
MRSWRTLLPSRRNGSEVTQQAVADIIVFQKKAQEQVLGAPLWSLGRVKDITSVANPDPPDPHVFGPPGSGSFCHRAKIVRKTLIPTILRLFLTLYL